MTSFTVKVNVEQDGEYYNINSYLDDLVESEDHVEDIIATLLVKTTIDRMNEIKKSITEGHLEDLLNEYEALVKEATANEKAE